MGLSQARSVWLVLSKWWVAPVGVGALLGGLWVAQKRQVFLPGTTSDGHHLIEHACASCHSGFEPVNNATCTECHQQDLARDSHSVSLFDDPRWAEDLKQLDARRCATCHGEHRIAPGGSTAEPTFCFPCHDDVPTKRASHARFEPASCGAAGCHNYHDNSALNTSFLLAQRGKPETLPSFSLPVWRSSPPGKPLPAVDAPPAAATPEIVLRWTASRHAAASVSCSDCHGKAESFVERPGIEACARCHSFETDTFAKGKHGMRGEAKLTPLTPELARLPMKPAGSDRPAAMSCGTCHDVHSVDTARAATAACLSCHDDEHSRNFADSPHARLADRSDGRAITCASCHLPRLSAAGEPPRVAVSHNNSLTARPVDRMASLVCSHCHSFELALSSLISDEQIRSNFKGRPEARHETFRLIDSYVMAQEEGERQ